jgi:hypothetical protein
LFRDNAWSILLFSFFFLVLVAGGKTVTYRKTPSILPQKDNWQDKKLNWFVVVAGNES